MVEDVVEDVVESQRTSSVKQQRRQVNTLVEATAAKEHSDELMQQAKGRYDSAWGLGVLRLPPTNLPDDLVAGAALAPGGGDFHLLAPKKCRAPSAPAPRRHDVGGAGAIARNDI